MNKSKVMKKTRLGRMAGRLLGEEHGAVMMEYVVLAALLVAAVVGAVIVFGNRIRSGINASTQALGGNTDTAQQIQSAANTGAQQDMATAAQEGKTINGGRFQGGGTQVGTRGGTVADH